VRKFTVIFVMSAVALSGGALFATSASARVSSTPGVCKQLTSLKITPSSDPTANGGRSNANKLSKALTKAAKKAKGDIKNTLNTLASYFKSAAAGDVNALQNQAQAFAAAAQNFASYIASSCTGGSLPGGVSIPKVSIPTVPTS
jgi:hypothetical protein